MLRYLLRRMVAMPLLPLGIASAVFLLSGHQGRSSRGSFRAHVMGNAEVVGAAKARWGLDKSLPERYLIYMGRLVQGDLGTSFTTRRPVPTDIGDRHRRQRSNW